MHFCIDCIHYQEPTGECLHSQHQDLVTGKQYHRSAGLERTLDYSGCGKEGQFYKPLRKIDWADLDDLSTIPFGSQ